MCRVERWMRSKIASKILPRTPLSWLGRELLRRPCLPESHVISFKSNFKSYGLFAGVRLEAARKSLFSRSKILYRSSRPQTVNSTPPLSPSSPSSPSELALAWNRLIFSRNFASRFDFCLNKNNFHVVTMFCSSQIFIKMHDSSHLKNSLKSF